MKVSELMIGDWVKLTRSDDTFKWKGCDYNLYYDTEIKPIPLTEEILKANGFEETYIDAEFDLVKIGNFMLYKRKPDTNYPAKKYFSSACHCEFEINYVHELQHVLRLCGLNKLTDNFIVNKL